VTPRPRIAFVVSHEQTAKAFLAGHLKTLSKWADVSLIANTTDPKFLNGLGVRGTTFPVGIRRNIRPLQDIAALISLVRLFRSQRFDAVHSVTPKAGLLGMLAAWLARVPTRTHTYTGQIWANKRGASRLLFRGIDGLIHVLTTFSLVDSPSQRQFLIDERVLDSRRSGVLADGSIAGVDLERFRADPDLRRAVRLELGLDETNIVFLFLGRLTRDKGVLELAEAFARLAPDHLQIALLIVGPDEEQMTERIRKRLGGATPRVRFVGYTTTPERYIVSADVFCLPSYREGFGSVLIEAAAAGTPSLASRIYGVTDAVEDGVTGLLHRPADVDDLVLRMERLAVDHPLRRRLGAAALARASAIFPAERLQAAMAHYYRVGLSEKLG